MKRYQVAVLQRMRKTLQGTEEVTVVNKLLK
jgi:hypothetical protein